MYCEMYCTSKYLMSLANATSYSEDLWQSKSSFFAGCITGRGFVAVATPRTRVKAALDRLLRI